MSDLPFKLKSTIFIISPPHSGSTLLRNMLAQHPNLYSPPELYLLPFISMAERKKVLGKREWLFKGLIQTFAEVYQVSYEIAEDMVKQLEDEDVAIPYVYGMIQANIGDKILVDKSPMNAGDYVNLKMALACFENPKLLHLHRHPLSGLSTFLRRPNHFKDKLPKDLTDKQWIVVQRQGENVWLNCHAAVLAFSLEHPRHYVRVGYEKLLKNPEKEMKRLCKFLKLAYDEKMLNPYEETTTKKYREVKSGEKEFPLGDPRFYMHDAIKPEMAERWKKVKTPTELKEETSLMASFLGYRLPKNYVETEFVKHVQERAAKPELQASVRGRVIPSSARNLKILRCAQDDPT